MIFYVLRTVNSSTSKYSEFKPVGKINREQPPCCSECGLRLGPLKRISPLNYKMCGTKIGDLITDGMVFATSALFKQKFEEAGLKGIDFSEKINLKGAPGSYYLSTPAYSYTKVDLEGSCADIDEVINCSTCRTTYRNGLGRLRIDESTWEGDDVFYVNLPGLIVATCRFYEFVRTNGFTNFDLIHQDDYRE